MRLKQTVEKQNTPAGLAFDLTIQSLIVLSLLAFSIETLPKKAAWMIPILHWFEVVTVVLFTAEYLVRLLVASRKLGFVLSFFGIIDLLAIAPFYLGLGVDLRSLRALRLLRLFRAFKLLRYGHTIDRFRRTFIILKEELVLFGSVTVLLLFFSATGIYYFEHDAQPQVFSSILHSLWWAVATLTTVGYGDIFPVTAGGKLFTFVMLMVGLGIIAVPTALIASALTEVRQEHATSVESIGRASKKPSDGQLGP